MVIDSLKIPPALSKQRKREGVGTIKRCYYSLFNPSRLSWSEELKKVTDKIESLKSNLDISLIDYYEFQQFANGLFQAERTSGAYFPYKDSLRVIFNFSIGQNYSIETAILFLRLQAFIGGIGKIKVEYSVSDVIHIKYVIQNSLEVFEKAVPYYLLRFLKMIFIYSLDSFYILFHPFLIHDYLLLSSCDGHDNNGNSPDDVDTSSIEEKLKNLSQTEKETLEMLHGLNIDRRNAEKALKLLPDKHKPEIKEKIDDIIDEIESNPVTQNDDFIDKSRNIEEELSEFINITIESEKECHEDLKEIKNIKKELEEQLDGDSSGSVTPTQESYNAEIARARAEASDRSPTQVSPNENPPSGCSSIIQEELKSENKPSLNDCSNIDPKGSNNNLPNSELKGLENTSLESLLELLSNLFF